MRDTRLAALALVLAAAGCGGGGGVIAGPAPAPPTSAPGSTATMSLSISIPDRTTSSAARTPRYVSNGTRAFAVYDGATLLYAGNVLLTPTPAFVTPPVYSASGSTTVTPGTCIRGNLASTCTLTITSTTGPHTFGVTAYGDFQGGFTLPGSLSRAVSAAPLPTFTGLILSEGEQAMTAVGGANPTLTITLLGVADIVQFFGPQTSAYNATSQIGYAIQDARSGQIVLPGNSYDNGPVTITASPSSAVVLTPSTISQSTPPATNGAQTFDVKCVAQNTTIVTFTASAGTHPNTAYASGLTYNSGNYPSAPAGAIGTTTFQCGGNPAN